MKVSYNWLKEYLNIDIKHEKVSEILTDIGLEVGGVEEFQSVKGGLEGIVIGEVKTKERHPNADKLSVTTVDVGRENLLNIVCGAPNVEAGQKVVVATIGTTLYSDNDDSFVIKKSKIRGELSEGMICAEDELGLGESHEGIMVLEESSVVGTLAKDFFKIENDIVFEIDLTPNRVDGASHLGVARDVAAYLKQTQDIDVNKPSVDDFKVDNNNLVVEVNVENNDACPRYSGITISDVEVTDSPDWLKNRLKSIGINPKNNIVDITNFVLHETGQPLHAFDVDEIKDNKVIVKTLPKGQKFVTLDEIERELSENDLMICNSEEGMCIAGVLGGLQSGVKKATRNIFLESAYFDPVFVRKTAKRHLVNSDSSFRFERGTDPNNTLYALKRAALLIKEIAGGNISSDIIDIYPNQIKPFSVELTYTNVNRLIGKELDRDVIKNILSSLDIEIVGEKEKGLLLDVPTYRVDVKREVDVIEEILRIYGYNNIEISEHVNSSLSYFVKPDKDSITNIISNQLSSNGFNEIMSNSLTKSDYYENNELFNSDETVKIFNPLSIDLNGMRQTLLFGGLESIEYNSNRKNSDLKLYEFGNCYYHNKDAKNENSRNDYSESYKLALFLTGNKNKINWNLKEQPTTFFTLKSVIENILLRIGIDNSKIECKSLSNNLFSTGLNYSINTKSIVDFGMISKKMLKSKDIKADVYYAEFNWDNVLHLIKKNKIEYKEISKYPEVKRDLALLIDKSVTFEQIKDIAFKNEKKLLKSVSIFDIYEDEKIGASNKSYAVSFILQDENKTLTDKQIDKIMNKFISVYKRDLDAQIR